MEISKRYREIFPYLIVLGIAVWLYYVADHIVYAAIPDQMGPDRWPKMITAALAIVSGFEILRRFLTSAPAELAPKIEEADDGLIHPKQIHIGMVLGAIAATIGYLLALERFGFAFSTVVYASCLMWLGGFRRLLVVVPCACALTVLFTFIFMRLIFVALPLGQGPFEKLSLALMSLVGVH